MVEIKRPADGKRPAANDLKGRRTAPQTESDTGRQRPDRKKTKKPPRKRSLLRSAFKAMFWLAFMGVIAASIGAYMGYSYFAQELPPIDSLKNYQPKTVTFVYSDDGRIIGEFSNERRIVVPMAKIPKHVREAFIAAEDANFYNHPGVDVVSIFRAFVKNLQAGEIVQGGSTITQQVISSFLLSKEKKYSRKAKEAILAYRITQNLTKDEVLYLYLNQIYLGNQAYGVESAANMYFDKHVDQLSVAEAALLAGMPKAPSEYSPFRNPERARERQVYTLNQMLENNFITREVFEAAKEEKLRFTERENPTLTVTPYYTEHVRRLLIEKYGETRVYEEGFKVYAAVNIEYYQAAAKAVAMGLREFAKRREYGAPEGKLEPGQVEKFLADQAKELGDRELSKDEVYKAVVAEANTKSRTLKIRVGALSGTIPAKELAWAVKAQSFDKLFTPGAIVRVSPLGKDEKTGDLRFSLEQQPQVHAAIMSVENATGEVKAMIGGRDFKESQFNRAIQAKRQPGSSFKPIIYTAAMDNGFTPGSTLIDAPIVYDDFAHGRRWKPTNFDRKFYGCTDLYTGLTSSRNVMAIKLLDKVGYEAVFETAKKLGIDEKLPENLTLALGSCGVSLEQMVRAFTTFPNLGERVEPIYITRIEDRSGALIEKFEPVRIRAVSSGTACVIQHMLLGVVAHGTGTAVQKLGRPVGGKTGTTNDLADAWFVGFTPEYTTGAWVGRDEMKRMGWGESGGRAAAPIFLYYMQDVLEGKPIRDFEVPPDATIVNNGSVGICYKAGTEGTGYSECGETDGKEEFLKSDLSEFDKPM